MAQVNEHIRQLELGLIVSLTEDGIDASLDRIAGLGLTYAQLSCWKPDMLSDELAAKVRDAVGRSGVAIRELWAGHTPPCVWDFMEGPATIGLVPEPTRDERIEQLRRGADFAKSINASAIVTHVGFLPEDPNDPQFPGVLDAIYAVAAHCQSLGLRFLFETGQETPVALLRTIERLGARGLTSLGINLDPANLVMYGKANPLDALDVLGRHVACVHAKDGRYPTDGDRLGKETALGDGKVDFPALITRLKTEFGYTGPLIIEREIEGPRQTADIERAMRLLSPLL